MARKTKTKKKSTKTKSVKKKTKRDIRAKSVRAKSDESFVMLVGEQSAYEEEYATTKLLDYIKDCEKPRYYGVKPYKELVIKLPSKQGYGHYIGFSTRTLDNWEAKYEEFEEAMQYLKEKQEEFVLMYGGKVMTPSIAKLVLTTHHGYKDRKEVETKYSGLVKHVYGKADERREALLNDPKRKKLYIDNTYVLKAPKAK